jgi:MFS family permease
MARDQGRCHVRRENGKRAASKQRGFQLVPSQSQHAVDKQRTFPQTRIGLYPDVFPAVHRESIPTNCTLFKYSADVVIQGINAIIYYAPTIFGSLGLNVSTTSLLATGVLGVIDFLFTFPAIFFVDRFGRRKFLMAGAIGMMISHVVVAGILGHYGQNFNLAGGKVAGWVGIVFIWVSVLVVQSYASQSDVLQAFGANFSYSWGPVAWLLASELFSPGHRSQAVSIIISCNYMMNFVVGQVTPNMLEALKFGTYIFFAAFCLLMFLWVWFLVPETRYKSLEEMDAVFGDNLGQVDQERMREIMSEIGLEPATHVHHHDSTFINDAELKEGKCSHVEEL